MTPARLRPAAVMAAAALACLLAGQPERTARAATVQDAGREDAAAPRLDARIACSSRSPGSGRSAADPRADADADAEYADSAEMHLQGDRIASFRWESSLFRRTTGFECSIDDSDGLQAQYLSPVKGDPPGRHWRVRLQDGRAARARRGYDADHGFGCSIRITQVGDQLQLLPSCPALCGSRENFSALTVDLRTGQCAYER